MFYISQDNICSQKPLIEYMACKLCNESQCSASAFMIQLIKESSHNFTFLYCIKCDFFSGIHVRENIISGRLGQRKSALSHCNKLVAIHLEGLGAPASVSKLCLCYRPKTAHIEQLCRKCGILSTWSKSRIGARAQTNVNWYAPSASHKPF